MGVTFFFFQNGKSTSEHPKLQGEAKKKMVFFYLELRSPVFGEKKNKKKQKFNVFDKIDGGFMWKVDYGKSSKIMFKLSVLWRRQNGVHQTSVSAVPNEQKVLIWKKPWKNSAWRDC